LSNFPQNRAYYSMWFLKKYAKILRMMPKSLHDVKSCLFIKSPRQEPLLQRRQVCFSKLSGRNEKLTQTIPFGCRVSGVGCRVSGVGCRVSGVGCRVSGVGCRSQLYHTYLYNRVNQLIVGIQSNQLKYSRYFGITGGIVRLSIYFKRSIL
jgi:hypothetical protein